MVKLKTLKESTRTYSEGERERAKQEYITQRQILRARMSDLTMEKIKRIVACNLRWQISFKINSSVLYADMKQKKSTLKAPKKK